MFGNNLRGPSTYSNRWWHILFFIASILLTSSISSAFASSDVIKGATILSGQTLKLGEFLISPSGEFFLTTQSDGNFCVYHEFDGSFVWCSRSSSAGEGDYFTAMQTDGNLCTYRTGGNAAWCLTNQARNDGPFFLALQDDANVCIYRGVPGSIQGTVWCSMALAQPHPHGPLVRYGQIYHLQNGYQNWAGGYLDTRGGNCEGNALCVSTATLENRDAGSGRWMIVSAESKPDGSPVMRGDKVYLKNLYRLGYDDMPPYGLFGGYLDTRGGGCEGNILCVSTSLTRNTNTNTSVWTVVGERHSLFLGQGIRLRNNYASQSGNTYLDSRGGGCEGNLLCVSTSLSPDRDSGTGWWRFQNDGPSSALIQQLAPVIHLSTEENYYPSSVESFFENTELRNGYYVTKQSLGCDSCTDPAFLRGNRPDTASVPVYAMVVQKADGFTTDLVYWTFYPYNNGKRVCVGLYFSGIGCVGGYSTFGNHVGDWEHVTIRLVNMVPTQIALSQHDSGATFNWGDPRVQMSGTHPVFYAATGSHGLYPDARRHTYRYLPNGDTLDDDTSAGVAWNTWNNLVEIRRKPSGQYAGNLSWLNFEGRWGNPESGCGFSSQVSGECVLNDGPTGPMLKPASDPNHQAID